MVKYCECGCSELVKYPERGHRFIWGHGSRNRKLTIRWNKIKDIKKYCKCGCESKIIIKLHHKYQGIPDYIHGHATKGKKYCYDKDKYKYNRKESFEEWNKLKKIVKYCKCGCGSRIKILPQHKYSKGIPNYIIGHHNKGKFGKDSPNYNKKRSLEARKNMSIAQLKYIEENNRYIFPNVGKIEPIFEETVLKKIPELKYEAQKRINRIGIVDFFLTDYGIIIECDEKCHKKSKQKSKDAERDFLAGFIFKYKYVTIRFTDTKIANNPKECIREIKKCIRMRS